MTGHRNRHVHIELQVLFNRIVHRESIVGRSVKKFSQIILSLSFNRHKNLPGPEER